MAIEMAGEAGPFFSFLGFMSCISVAELSCYGPLKINPSYSIVHYYVIRLFVYFGGPPTAMNAVLAIFAHCRRQASNCCTLQRGSRNKLISHLLYNFILNPSMVASSNPF
jgi:hypothetical protein